MTSFLSYQCLATGSTTARTFPDRYNDIYNVKDFGAIGDGSADDSAAINNAIAAAYTKGGTAAAFIIYFPPGTYFLNSNLPIDLSPPAFAKPSPPNRYGAVQGSAVFMGAGRDATILKANYSTGLNFPPWGNYDAGAGGGGASLPMSFIVVSSTGGQNICEIRDMTVWNTNTSDKWSGAINVGLCAPPARFKNLKAI